jgi:hypothetical protein
LTQYEYVRDENGVNAVIMGPDGAPSIARPEAVERFDQWLAEEVEKVTESNYEDVLSKIDIGWIKYDGEWLVMINQENFAWDDNGCAWPTRAEGGPVG